MCFIVDPKRDPAVLNLFSFNSVRVNESLCSHHVSRMIASICVKGEGGAGRRRVWQDFCLFSFCLALQLMTHTHCKSGPSVCQRPLPGRTDDTQQETSEAPRPVPNLLPPTANTAPLHKRQAAGGSWETEGSTLISNPVDVLLSRL